MAGVGTVTGAVPLDALGTTLVHEHLKVRSEQAAEQFPHLYGDDEALRLATETACALLEQGVRTICDRRPARRDAGAQPAPLAERRPLM